MKEKSQKPSPKHSLRKWLCIAAGTALAVVVLIGIYAGNLMDRIHYVDPAATPTLSQQELNRIQEAETVPDRAATQPSAHRKKIFVPVAKEDKVVNILLIGQDRRSGGKRARSDAMILCTFHTSSQTLTLTSFLRDLWVEIPGYQDNKLNAAYVAGGMKLLDQTLEHNFGVHVDGNVEVDFQQFAQIVDLLGGVEMELRSDEARYINRALDTNDLTAGAQILNGKQALCYCRIRSLDRDADFSRTNRQRKMIDALVKKYRNTGIPTALSLLDDILPMITTDMTRRQLISYGYQLLPMLPSAKIISQRIPADGTFTTPVIRNMSVLLADMDAARQLLKQSIESG